ncbi:uncharacterized protein LOC133931275 [Phragmites australis]|uniref:uncharacterized protein LOC133931275 n=1 Tax=Phragmites australis TaxID=29695 RepID=UPI002D77E6BD|nr:uncharacterized protein LOC133931275 [Phragmites australis]XP_062234111.1 uncharacterized protein LOC133931275 [Phragmites australis]
MKGNPIMKALATAAFGFLIGVSFPVQIAPKLQCGRNILGRFWVPVTNSTSTVEATPVLGPNATTSEIVAPAKPKGAARLPPNIVVSESDLHLRRLWGNPREDTPARKYLLALTVGYSEKVNVNATVHKFSDNFDVVLFHYDGRTTEWDDEFEWSKQVLHISAWKQAKWWYAKRFLHPSIVAPYEYIFIWDEDLGVETFDGEEYVRLVRKHGLEISQPGLDITRGKKSYEITIRRNGSEIHKNTIGGPGNCSDVHQRPCSGFVEIMAPVFSRDAWACAWHMVQNDLVHGWGLDSNFWRCVDEAEEQIGVVDAQYVAHRAVPTLGRQGNPETGGGGKVRQRSWAEWGMFKARMINAERAAAAAAQPRVAPPE